MCLLTFLFTWLLRDTIWLLRQYDILILHICVLLEIPMDCCTVYVRDTVCEENVLYIVINRCRCSNVSGYYRIVVSAQGLPGPQGDVGPEGPQGKQVSPLLNDFYFIVHICCDLYISFYDQFKQEVGALPPRLLPCSTEACLSGPVWTFGNKPESSPSLLLVTSKLMNHQQNISLQVLLLACILFLNKGEEVPTASSDAPTRPTDNNIWGKSVCAECFAVWGHAEITRNLGGPYVVLFMLDPSGRPV